ncbi:hypothetical protein CJ030_MR7G010615 [Morella rubra]|uniref:FAF domain-containing protein n=1 Tax=Morella rubra TaxID=262757 RepID=A0A6A1UYD4_9ROSI|nr:hypothetical protein CJ030_MR7G010615 [Morella rubra]
MDFPGEGFLCKAKSTVSSLRGIVLWVRKLASPVQSHKELTRRHHCLQPGLKTLIYPAAESPHVSHHSVHKSSSGSPHLLSSILLQPLTGSSSSSWIKGDLIGTESGVYLSCTEDEIKAMEKPEPCNREHDTPNQRCAMTRDYPPPISLLVQTGNLRGRMPWVLARCYVDGKLILKFERSKHNEHLESHRENGRLVLNLVKLEYPNICHCGVHEAYGEELELEELQFIEDTETEEMIDQDQEEEHQQTEAAYYGYEDDVDITVGEDTFMASLASSMPVKWVDNRGENDSPTNQRYQNLRKCFTYAGVFDSNSFGTANTREHLRAYLAQPDSAPVFPIRTATVV